MHKMIALLLMIVTKYWKRQAPRKVSYRALKPKPRNDTIQAYLRYIKRRFPGARDWTWDFEGDYIYLRNLNSEIAYGLSEFFGGRVLQGQFVLCVSL